jgi:aldehyde dehydrogenase (NAD+)
MKPKRVCTPLVLQPGRSFVFPEPYGVALVIGPWNYPFQLILSPVVAALAAGNTVVLKPSELANRTTGVITAMISKCFEPGILATLDTSIETRDAFLKVKFDTIFFTGGPVVGKLVYQAAAAQMTPVSLELGGKSPCIVHSDADLDIAARRIVFGKFTNAGQTCVAPDYLLAHSAVRDRLVEKIRMFVDSQLGPDPAGSPDYCRIISDRHFERLAALVQNTKVIYGGQMNPEDRYFAPTLVEDPGDDHPLMQEEIFGPILPIATYDSIDQALSRIRKNPNPLSLYVFTSSREIEDKVLHSIPFGGGCVNDTIVHLGNPNLPFGGVGGSGIGAYHGESGFHTFSHHKSVLRKSTWIDPPFRYRPYAKWTGLLRWLLK